MRVIGDDVASAEVVQSVIGGRSGAYGRLAFVWVAVGCWIMMQLIMSRNREGQTCLRGDSFEYAVCIEGCGSSSVGSVRELEKRNRVEEDGTRLFTIQ